MVKHIKHISLLFVLGTLLSVYSFAQKIDAFARVSVVPHEGVVRQAYKVTITVHSSTWFAKPLQFTNLHIDDAFIIPFTRTVSSINYINNKKYATLSFYYLVFPYSTGDIKIPELEINANIPPEGGYKGEPVLIRTKQQMIKVKAVPSSKDENVWTVANNITINDNWSKNIETLKVGDVVEREIIITASGTLPSLIQPLIIEKPEFTSIYPREPELQDKRTDKSANGVRIERYSYLFEDEVEIIIPEEQILWWNPTTESVYKRTIPEKKITIKANPDLAMMESLKDSLLAMSAPLQTTEEEPFSWTLVGLLLIVLLLAGYFGIKSLRYAVRSYRKNRIVYLQSEAYCFKQLQDALDHKTRKEFIRLLYIWFDKVRDSGQSASISDYLNWPERDIWEDLIQTNEFDAGLENKNQFRILISKLRENLVVNDTQKGRLRKLNPV
ncbi:BatD family protein [uncultured Draconibacterium sp.]|uniref:BatD family protein n=1 Tax=uncultured Draconibacterium sp. TaxID=1573823 RepID=UPI0032164E98